MSFPRKCAAILGALAVGLSASLVATPSQAAPNPQARPQAPAPAPELDDRVIFQSFSLFQPYESNMYQRLGNHAGELAGLGVTDVWLPPGYRSFGIARYQEGYAVADRYDLGEFPNGIDGAKATKYGTSEELKGLMNNLHAAGVRGQMDLVPNQVMGLTGQEAVKVTRADHFGNEFTNPLTTKQPSKIDDQIYLAYTKGGGPGQQKYGLIKEFDKSHFNGTSLQQLGMGDVLKDDKGKPYRVHQANAADNNPPSWWDQSLGINDVEGYISARGAFELTKDNWKPTVLKADPGFAKFAVDSANKNVCGYRNAKQLEAPGDSKIWGCRDAYLASQAKYGLRSEEPTYANDNSGIDWDDTFVFDNHGPLDKNFGNEFLVGNDLNNADKRVQDEQRHWMQWMLDTYGFDGFRIDAAAHYDTEILKIEDEVTNAHFGGDRSKYTSYLEAYYEGAQGEYLDGQGNRQLAMDGDLFYNMQGTLGRRNSPAWLRESFEGRHSVADRINPGEPVRPNWSFVNNHDQEKNRVNTAIQRRLKMTPYQQWGDQRPRSFEEEYTPELQAAALRDYNADLDKVDKELSPVNVPSMYAIMLTNANTVPTVFYGDMYRTDASYMTAKTPYYDSIVNLLKARKQYAKGRQHVDLFQTPGTVAPGQQVVASVREGDSRGNGLATVVANVPTVNTTVRVNMGRAHHNQKYRDITGNYSEQLVTDGQGFLTVPVKGKKTKQVHGSLGVWVPVDDGQTVAVHGAIKAKYDELGGARGFLGKATGIESCFMRDGGCFQSFQGGRIYWSPKSGAHFVRGDIDRRWGELGWETGYLGYPTSDEICKDGYCTQSYQGGDVTWRPDGRRGLAVKGLIDVEWRRTGGAAGAMGPAQIEEQCWLRDGGCFQRFDRGHIYWQRYTGAHFMRGEIFKEYGRLGWEAGRMGFPTSPEYCGLKGRGCFQTFEREGSAIYWSPRTGAHPVRGKIREHWATQRWEKGRFGYPLEEERCSVNRERGLDCSQRFQGGTIRWSSKKGYY